MYSIIIGEDILSEGSQAITVINLSQEEIDLLLKVFLSKGMEILIRNQNDLAVG